MKIIRRWIADDDPLDIAEFIIDVMHDALDKAFPNWWAEFTNDPADEGLTWGYIEARVWLDMKDHDDHFPSDFHLRLGYWRDHPRFHGAWYYYYESSYVKKGIERKLKDIMRETANE